MTSMLADPTRSTEPSATRPAKTDAEAPRPTRQERIAIVAYRLAEQRGFAPGAELDDWLQAEREVDAEDGRQA